MASPSFLLRHPQPAPAPSRLLLPPPPPLLLRPATHRFLFFFSSSSPFRCRLRAVLLPKDQANIADTFLASHLVAGYPATLHGGRDPPCRSCWKASFSGRPPPAQLPTGSPEGEEHPPSGAAPVPAIPTLPFGSGDLLLGTLPGFWMQLWIAALSRVLLWAIRRPTAPGFPRPVVAAWVVLGLWRAISPDAKLGLVPLDRLVAGVTGKRDLLPVEFSAAAAALLLAAVGSFEAMDRLSSWTVREVARRNLTPEAAIAAFCVWSLWVVTGAGKGGAGGGHWGGRAPRWWEVAMRVAWVQVLVFCLCLPHNLVKYVVLVLGQLRNTI